MKQKWLDRKCGRRSRNRIKGNHSKGKDRQIPLDELPFREAMRQNARRKVDWFGEYRYQVDYKPINEFLMSKVDKKWDDVYSELLSKIKEKNKWWLRDNLSWIIEINPCYIGNYPYNSRWCAGTHLLYNDIFVDKFGYVRYYETEEELIFHTKRILREQKLRRIFNEK